MQFEVQGTDFFDQKFRAIGTALAGHGFVSLDVDIEGEEYVWNLSLSADRARELAEGLLWAANIADGGN